MNYWFPNIRRMHDPATAWLHAVLRELDDEELVLAVVFFRMTGGNREALERLLPMLTGPGYDEHLLLEAVGRLDPLVNGRILPHLRIAHVAELAAAGEAIQARGGLRYLLQGAPLREAHRALHGIPHVGAEMAFEMAWDLLQTDVLRGAPGWRSWAYPTQGAVHAAGLLLHRDLGPRRRQDCLDTEALMKTLHEEGADEFPSWTIAEIQRGLTMFYFWAREAEPTRRFRWN